MSDKPDVWLGVKRCGHAVAVCVDAPEHKKETEKSKRDFLRDGLSVVHATWDEWESKWRVNFMTCDCQPKEASDELDTSKPPPVTP